MKQPSTPEPERTGRALCLMGAAIGLIVLEGWLFRPDIVARFTGTPAMMPNTALALVAGGLSAANGPRRAGAARIRSTVADALALMVLAIGMATVLEYGLGRSLGIDQMLAAVPPDAPYPGRPSPITALSLSLLGLALLMGSHGRTRAAQAAQWLTLGAGFLAFVSLVGHAYGAAPMYQIQSDRVIGVAVPTAIAFLLVTLGMLLRNPDVGVMPLAASRRPGGLLVRRLGTLAVLGTPILGALAYRAVRLAGVIDVPLTLAVLTMIGVPLAVAIIVITAGRLDQMHEALEASRERARVLIEESVDGIFVADLDGRYTDVNAAGCRMLGYAREDIVGRAILDLLAPDEVDRFIASRERLLAGATHRAEWHLRRRDGTYVPVEVGAKVLADGRWQAIVRDITRRRAAEEAARESMERFRFLANAGEVLSSSLEAGDIVARVAEAAVKSIAECCVVELANGESLMVTRCDHGAHREEAPFLLASLDLRQPLLIPEAGREWLRSLGPDQSIQALTRGARTSVMAVPIGLSGGVAGAILLLSGEGRRYGEADLQLAVDLARRTATALVNGRLYREAQTATRARDELLGIVAHDLRAPLTAVLFGANVLADQVPDERREVTRTTVATVQRSIRRATRLVDDLLDVARIDAGGLEIQPAALSPHAVVQEALHAFGPAAANASVGLEAELAPGLCPIAADEDRIQQALGNLLDNAIKFTPEGGRVRIVAAPDENGVRFDVIDSGPGIPPDDLSRVFDRFWQARSTRRGAGLGLAITKGIVEAHGGRIWAESVPGRGSTFSFVLPAWDAEGTAKTRSGVQTVDAR